MRKILLFLSIFLLSFSQSTFADYIYFYGEWCSHCAKVQRFFDQNNVMEKFEIEKKEVWSDINNSREFLQYGRDLGISESKLWVPFMVTENGEWYLMGDVDIIDHFQNKLKNIETSLEPINQNNQEIKEKTFWQFFLILLPASLSDSINPCVFAVMLILLWGILNKSGSRKKMVFSGLLFILAIFTSYLLMGIWLYRALASADSVFYLKLWVAILGILVWLANLKDFFWYGKWFIMEVPLAWRPKMKKILDSVVSPFGAFIIWFVVSLFLLPCTSGPYITILGYLAAESSSITTMGYIYMIIYNLIFILPMFIIILVVSFWYKTVEELKEYKEFYKREVHLVVAILMFILSGYILYDIFM